MMPASSRRGHWAVGPWAVGPCFQLEAPGATPGATGVLNLKLRGAWFYSLDENGHHADLFGLLSELGSAVLAVT